MKATKNNLREAMRSMAPPAPREAKDFWDDFRARAALVPQAAPEASSTMVPRLRFAMAMAAVLVFVGLLAALLMGPRDTGAVATVASGPATPDSLSRVEEVQVFLDNASVMVFEDTENGGTVVFVESTPPPEKT